MSFLFPPIPNTIIIIENDSQFCKRREHKRNFTKRKYSISAVGRAQQQMSMRFKIKNAIKPLDFRQVGCRQLASHVLCHLSQVKTREKCVTSLCIFVLLVHFFTMVRDLNWSYCIISVDLHPQSPLVTRRAQCIIFNMRSRILYKLTTWPKCKNTHIEWPSNPKLFDKKIIVKL